MRNFLSRKNIILGLLFLICITSSIIARNLSHTVTIEMNSKYDIACNIHYSDKFPVVENSKKIEFKSQKGNIKFTKKIPLSARFISLDFGYFYTDIIISKIKIDNSIVKISSIQENENVLVDDVILVNGVKSIVNINDCIDSWKNIIFDFKYIFYFLSCATAFVVLYLNKFTLKMKNAIIAENIYYMMICFYAIVYFLIKFRICKSFIHVSSEPLYKYIVSLKHEMIIVSLVCFVFLVMASSRRKFFRYFCLVLLTIVSFVFVSDVCVHYELSNRLIFDNIPLWLNSLGGGAPIIFDFIGHSFGILSILLLVLVVVLYLFIGKNNFIVNKKSFIICFSLIVISCVFYRSDIAKSVHEYNAYNVYEVNNTNQNKAYSSNYKFKDGFYLEYKSFDTGIKKRKNVILLIVESYSVSNSKLISECNNLSPNIDRHGKNAYIFNNYITNGGHTVGGIFSILTGHPFLHGKNSVYQKDFYENSFIHLFKKMGYKISMFYPAISVGGFDAFLQNLPFDIISLDTDKNYIGKPRFVFNSVDDSVLLNNVYNYICNEDDKFLTIVITTTMHAPFINPINPEKRSFEENSKFTDIAIGNFIEKLNKSGFFENGILFITGDHHAMLPLKSNEQEKYGNSAIARVPLIVFDQEIEQRKNDAWFDHCSLGGFIQLRALGEYKVNQFQIDPVDFDDKLILHQYISPADTVLVVNRENGSIKLDGDKTRFSFSFDGEDDYYRYIYWLRSFR